MTLRSAFCLSGILWGAWIAGIRAQDCTIREQTWSIKTYPFSDPDPMPIFVSNPSIYPYFPFRTYSPCGQDQDWTVVVMENPYVRIFVLPQVGGKILGAVERSTGREFLYHNKVLKFRQIAMRGPWTSGGVEFNFGIVGHAPSTATPVDWIARTDSAGNAVCVVGTWDLASRTRWSVAITLPKDKAYVEIRPFWTNPTPFPQAYYCWINNAVHVGEDLEYFYPGRFRRPHGVSASLEPWPLDREGRDLSWYRNHDFGGDHSHFVIGEYRNFFGGIWHDSGFGFGHWARYDDMPGKKMWIWSLSCQGAIWENLLTDSDGQYSEPQAGRLFSQDDHGRFAPLSGDTWREILFPLKDLTSLDDASPCGGLSVRRSGQNLEIGFCPFETGEDSLIVTLDSKVVFGERVVFKTMATIRKRILLPKTDGSCSVRLGESLMHSENLDDRAIHRPIQYHVPDLETAEGLYLAGCREQNRRGYDQAAEKFRACLEKEPGHVRALCRLAELHGRKAEWEKGLEYASMALAEDYADPEANFVYGTLSRFGGRLVDAKETLGWAARSNQYRSAAWTQMTEIFLAQNAPKTALEYASRAGQADPSNVRIQELLAILLRTGGRIRQAQEVLEHLAQFDPLNPAAGFERFLNDSASFPWSDFVGSIRTELPQETFMETALSYTRIGRKAEAVRIFQAALPHPMAHLWLAFLDRNRKGGSSHDHLQKAEEAPPHLVFPFRAEDIEVLGWAVREKPGQWKFRYFFGLVLESLGRKSEALTWFESCGDPGFAAFHRLMARLNPDQAPARLRRAVEIDPKDWMNWHDRIQNSLSLGDTSGALELSEKTLTIFPGHMILSMDRASALYAGQKYDDCLGILDGLDVLPYEGAWEAHDLYCLTHLKLAMATCGKHSFSKALRHIDLSRDYPETLGTGRPFDPDLRLQDALESAVRRNLGQTAKADAIDKRIADYTERHVEEGGIGMALAVRILDESAWKERVDRWITGWKARSPQDSILEWILCIMDKNRLGAEEAVRQAGNRSLDLATEAEAVIKSLERRP